MIRFEILLPLCYNDGKRIEKEKFVQTDEELVAQFGATSTDTVIVSGRWIYRGTLYEDKLIRIRIDTEDFCQKIGYTLFKAQSREKARKWEREKV